MSFRNDCTTYYTKKALDWSVATTLLKYGHFSQFIVPKQDNTLSTVLILYAFRILFFQSKILCFQWVGTKYLSNIVATDQSRGKMALDWESVGAINFTLVTPDNSCGMNCVILEGPMVCSCSFHNVWKYVKLQQWWRSSEVVWEYIEEN